MSHKKYDRLIASFARSARRAERFKLAEGEFEKSKLYGKGIVFFKISSISTAYKLKLFGMIRQETELCKVTHA